MRISFGIERIVDVIHFKEKKRKKKKKDKVLNRNVSNLLWSY
jgi:hypothetical protein